VVTSRVLPIYSCLYIPAPAIYLSRGGSHLGTRLAARGSGFERHPRYSRPPSTPHHYPRLTRTGTTLLQRLSPATRVFIPRRYGGHVSRCQRRNSVWGAQRIAAAKAESMRCSSRIPTCELCIRSAMGADEDILILDQTLLSNTRRRWRSLRAHYRWLRQTRGWRPGGPYPRYSVSRIWTDALRWQ